MEDADASSSSSRRAVLGRVAAGLTAALAGCSSFADYETPTRPPVRSPADGWPPRTVTGPPTTRPTGRTTVHVATDGDDDDPGTRERPLATLAAALERVRPGGSVRIGPGTYRVTGPQGPKRLDGTAADPVRVGGYPGERPVFDFSGASTGGFEVVDCEHLVLHDLRITGAPSGGVYVAGGSRHVRVEDVEVWACGGDPDAGGIGVQLVDAPDCTVRRVVSHENYDAPTGGENADGIAVATSPGARVEDCVAYGNADDGIDLWEGTDVTVRNCVAYGNGWAPDGSPAGDGNGFKLGGGDRPSGDNRVERCLAYTNRTRGFHDNDAPRPLTLYNCTAWNNPVNFRLACDLSVFPTTCPRHRARNNLSAEGATVLYPSVDTRANSWDRGIDDPLFVSTSPGDPGFLVPTARSPAVDAGVDVGLPYAGEAPDLGAIEFRPRG